TGGTPPVTELRPIAFDRPAALRLARRAIFARNDPESETEQFVSAVEREVESGVAAGVLRFDGDRAVGMALWEPPTAVGATVQLLYSIEGWQGSDEYRRFFLDVRGIAGPVAFAPGRLAGLTGAEEDLLMQSMGFARFVRSEMRLPPDSPTPAVPDPTLSGLRESRASDLASLARLHELAYRGHFDRYLFLTDPDPARNAELELEGIVGGKWGEFLPWASWVFEASEGIRAAALVVRAAYGPLIVDVMVDPALRGRGLGRAVLSATIRGLRGREESAIILNVTDGNRAAVRLYERLGFVRSLGPSHGWYSVERVPVPPGAG
ncbi:MAG: GNAT family N-acetyltransferase, partial [Thermoplasmata archaeon]